MGRPRMVVVHGDPPPTPACFDSDEQFLLWHIGAKQIAETLPNLVSPMGYCEGCQPDYASAMRAAGRCQHPEVFFDAQGQACLSADIEAELRTAAGLPPIGRPRKAA